MKRDNFGLRTPDSRLPVRSHGGNVHAFAHARGIALDQVLDFSASINPLGWPRRATSAYRRALSRIVHYPELHAETLTAALARYHNLDPRAILVGNGSTQLIYLLARTLGARRVLLIAPLFSEYETAFHSSGSLVERLFLRPPTFTLALDRLQSVLSAGYDVIVLTNPNSPTGALVPRARVEELAQLCRRTDTRLVVDETFVDWMEEESLKQLAARGSHLIVLRSLTKFFALSGLRVGYMIAQPRLIKRLWAQIEPWSVNTVAQEVALACVQDLPFARRSRAFMARERPWLLAQLAALKGLLPFPSVTNFLLVKITKSGLNVTTLLQGLMEENILVRDCGNFSGLEKRFFRVAVRTRPENLRLLSACAAVLK